MGSLVVYKWPESDEEGGLLTCSWAEMSSGCNVG